MMMIISMMVEVMIVTIIDFSVDSPDQEGNQIHRTTDNTKELSMLLGWLKFVFTCSNSQTSSIFIFC